MSDRFVREIVAVALLLGAVLVAVALLSHSPLDPSPFHVSTERSSPYNLAGWLGATLSAALLGLVGVSSLLLPVLGGVLGWWLLRRHELVAWRSVLAGWGVLFLAVPALAAVIRDDLGFRGGTVPCGGLIGRALAELLDGFAGAAGRLVILLFLLLLGILLVSGASVGVWVDRLLELLRRGWRRRRDNREQQRRERTQLKDRQKVLERQLSRLDREEEYRGTLTVKELQGRGRFRIVRKKAPLPETEPTGAPAPEASEEGFRDAGRPGDARGQDRKVSPEPEPPDRPVPSRRQRTARADGAPRPGGRAAQRRQAEEDATAAAVQEESVQEEFDFVEDLESYDIPRLSFLDEAEEGEPRDSAAMMEIARLITSKCQEFKVRGEVVNIRTGPVITTYEFRLDSGVKISAVQNLSDDLALALRTDSVRIDRVPGRATVGIEVPNPHPEVIRLRELIECTEFQKASSLLTLSLGVDIHGKPQFGNLARMPHLLIGGFTGSGKSVGINAMIMSILYKARPDEVKFIMVDPKMVELGVYADIPHLLTPIIVDPKKAANALGWAVAEMDNRYRALAGLGVRNLEQYNQLVRDPVQLRRVLDRRPVDDENEPPSYDPLPYIMIIIDELADLMMTSSRAVEESITRLAQKARAVGVHLICATQRPSVDILTGIIKANFPCRIAYKVRSKFDSRTILDAMGAEHLLGRGDMLFLPPGTSNLRRMHGPLVTEKEIASVVRYIKRFGKPEYQRDVLSHAALGTSDRSGGRGGGRRTVVDNEEELTDPMYDQAARVVIKTRKASASYIQRRLHLGYTRSARLLDMMEKEGLVGPLNGSKGRDVLVSPEYFDEVDETKALSPDDDLDDE